LSLPGGTSSNADPADIAGYVDLPNNIINVLTDLSIEAWITWDGSGSWQRIFDFGVSAGGEDISTGNGSYLFLSPQGPDALRFSVRDPETGAEPAPLTSATPLPTGQEIYVAVAYDQTANVARMYTNGVLAAYASAPVIITALDDLNNWLGRSQWPDALFQGKYNEFRIWNGVLMPGEVATHFAAGPDSMEAAPKLTAARSGQNLVVSWSAAATGYSLESAAQLGAGAVWSPVTEQPNTSNGITSVTVPIGTGPQFLRLKK
jgi:hypothetical protein